MKYLVAAAVALLSLASPASADGLSVTGLVVDPVLAAGKPYDVDFKYKGDAGSIWEVCFLWSGEGPYCWTNFSVDAGKKLIRTRAKTNNPGKYTFTGFVRYGDGGSQATKKVSRPIEVR